MNFILSFNPAGWATSTAILLMATTLSLDAAEASSAVYHGIKEDEFMKRWLVLSPIPTGRGAEPDEAAQKQAFASDLLKLAGGEAAVQPAAGQAAQIDGKDYTWRLVESQSSLIELTGTDAAKEFGIAYAWANIEMAQPAQALFGIGSDDAVKIWLNGKVIHENWVDRPTRKDDDLVELPLRKGSNQLLLKVQNNQGNWGFVCRPLSTLGLADKLVATAGRGELDEVRKLIDRGVSVNGEDPRGLTAWQAAKIHGYKEVADFLTSKGAETRLPQDPGRVVDATLKEIVHADWSGAAVLVAQNGRILFERAYGLANLEHRVPATPETRFRIGSITKQFVAAAILKLHEQGRLRLDDKLAKFIPDFPRGDEVTIHHLLTHTSGIHSYTSKPDFFETAAAFIAPEKLILSFKNDPYDFDPGKRWSYNNSGYFLLGFIIQKVSGESWDEFLRKTFFEPLGMTRTGVHRATDVIEHEAHGYAFEGGRMKKALNWDMSRAGGAGALYSTVGDLYRWNEALFGGMVLNQDSLKAAFTPVSTAENETQKPEEGYGYGWGIGKLRGLVEISHGGGLHGFTSYLRRVPEEKFTVVVLANAAPPPPGLNTDGLAHDFTELYLADKLGWRPTLVANKAVSPKAYDACVGRYDYGGRTLTVTREGDRLFAQLAGQGKYEIFPKSETEFFWKAVDAQITFVKDAQGKTTKGIHQQGGQKFDAPRIE